MTAPNTTASNRDRSTGPGARLAQARHDLHLGLDEVAAKLHLSMRQIEALEQDDYQGLPGTTYVRGYLKSYALLLGIDPGPVLDAHSQLTAKPSTPDFSVIAPQREITSRHHQIRIVTYLVAVIVIGLAIAWWQGRSTPTPSPLSAVPDETAASPTATQEPPMATAGESLADDPATPAAETGPAPPAVAAPPVAPAAAPAPIAPAPLQAVPAMPSTAAAPAGPRGTLIVHAEQDTWVDVRDSRQVKLLYETLAAGRTVTLEGTAPISIFLGNAAGARVEYNGRAVDVARHKRGVFARFTVGEEQASAAPQN